MRTLARFSILVIFSLACFATMARADYAVLKSGMRLHITGYQAEGSRIKLNVDGGVVEVDAADVVSIEPEDQFSFPVAPVPASSGVPYENLIRAAAARHGVDEKLVAKVIAAESNFNPRAVSPKQARGLMQLMPQTAALLSVRDVFDPAQNIDAGTKYLRELLDKYKGDLRLALAAYNAGPDMVEKYGGVPPFAETQSYVERILRAMRPSNGS
ncbi:MAG TPA: lytic transglycosylase domain-containing protein [Candidatus Acidoferrum sp.]|nr:lytic transglycosylase domain-containing protein [Candidatus Acidoferrum sp.]